MNKKAQKANLSSSKTQNIPHNNRMELAAKESNGARDSTSNRRLSRRERKLALLQDVDKLKKKLRQEENVHRALERAFSRPLGVLPRLPPYLPSRTLELLAEVAVLEEEIVGLEKKLMNFQQGLYKETTSLTSKISSENSNSSSEQSSVDSSKRERERHASPIEVISEPSKLQTANTLSRSASIRKIMYSDGIGNISRRLVDGKQNSKKLDFYMDDSRGKENRLMSSNSYKVKKSPEPNVSTAGTLAKRPPIRPEVAVKGDPRKTQSRLVEQDRAQESSSTSSDDRTSDSDNEANKVSEDLLKCLFSIFLRLSKLKGKAVGSESCSSPVTLSSNGNSRASEFWDPYGICLGSKMRDIGPYKHLFAIDAGSIDLKRKTNASFLIRRLKLLFGKLASVNLDGLTHHQKLAFWINTYNSCMMNAILEHGVPETPEKTVLLLKKASISVGGNVLNAVVIEHFILRLPYHLKIGCPKSGKNDEIEVHSKLGLEWSEPLVTFALCCGSWSSPAARVYTASQIENELEAAKRKYLQAAVGISPDKKLIIPKMIDLYLPDFAKTLNGLVDWLCLQLPDEIRNDAVQCLEKSCAKPVSQSVQVMPYDFRFRYLICR